MTGGLGPMAAAWRSAWSGPLAVRSFRLLAGGQLTSTIGDYCYAVALPWFVLSSRGGTILLGAVLVCYSVPRLVLIPFLGGEAGRPRPCSSWAPPTAWATSPSSRSCRSGRLRRCSAG